MSDDLELFNLPVLEVLSGCGDTLPICNVYVFKARDLLFILQQIQMYRPFRAVFDLQDTIIDTLYKTTLKQVSESFDSRVCVLGRDIIIAISKMYNQALYQSSTVAVQ